ncbi:MAG: hypothetical protein HRT64_07310 [Erythrobacter sp.]|nr:hypothetical protein [Erythrobacter sp.]
MLTLTRNSNSWQLILADLALILFLVTAAALSAGSGVDEARKDDGNDLATASLNEENLAPAQALFRAGPGLPTLAEWLESQPRDPRAALTIVAEHAEGQDEKAWLAARQMAATAQALGVRARIIIRRSGQNTVHASLAYDQPSL